MIEVRAASRADIDFLVPLVTEYHRLEGIEQTEAVTRETLEPLLEDSACGRIWLIHAGSTVVGYVAVCFGYSIELGGRDAYIDEMFVVEAYRARGIGSAAIEQVMQLLVPLRVRAVHLEVAHTNERALRVYQARGFKPRQRYFLMTRIVQAGDLPEPNPPHPLASWHRLVRERRPEGIAALVDDDAVFFSPVVHAPQRGKKLVVMYLSAAFQVFLGPSFRYVREIVGSTDAMLEFETEIDGVLVNGIDIIKWNEAGRIVEFKVMLRPLKAVNLIHERMSAMLQARAAARPGADP